jgi:hypothetical protein
MKRMMTIIAMGVLCMCVTSCSDICKDAYMAEQAYKLYRNKGWSDSTLYKNEFIEMYQSMTYKEQQRYKSYREKMDAELREQAAVEDFARMEALKMLSE